MAFKFDEEKHEYTIDGKKVPSVTEICGILSNDKYAINESILRQASARGTAVHEWTMLHDMDLEEEEIDPNLEPYIHAYLSFLRDYKPTWEFIETAMASKSLGYAGTVDRVGIVDDRRVIVDIKTTSSFDRVAKISVACQLFGYCQLYANSKMPQTVSLSHSFAVQLKKDGTYDIFTVKSIEEKYGFMANVLFNKLLDITRIKLGVKS